jgi:hypothetical protein
MFELSIVYVINVFNIRRCLEYRNLTKAEYRGTLVF